MMINFNSITGELEKLGITFSAVDISSVRSMHEQGHGWICESYLSSSEIAIMKDMKVLKRRMDYLSGRIAGKRALKGFLETREIEHKGKRTRDLDFKAMEIRKARTGAPRVFLHNMPARIRVSLSHAPGCAAGAVCGSEDYRGIGIDIEKIESRHGSFSDVAFSDSEKEALRNHGDGEDKSMDERITRYWSMKEAVLKSMGIGLCVDMKDIEITQKGRGSFQVVLGNEVMRRFDELVARDIDVSSYRVNDHIVSVARLR